MRMIICGLTALMLVSFPRNAIAQMGDNESSAKTPHWLAGCWERSAGELVIEEHWMFVRARTMLGMSRTVRGDELVGYELVLLREEESGWAYEAHPSGQQQDSFRLSAMTDTSIAFSNPDHDFPQTITYFRLRSDSLIARIAGERGGQLREVDFPYRRVACPGND